MGEGRWGSFCLFAGLFDYRDGPRVGKDGLYRVLLGSGIIYRHQRHDVSVCSQELCVSRWKSQGRRDRAPVEVDWTDAAESGNGRRMPFARKVSGRFII